MLFNDYVALFFVLVLGGWAVFWLLDFIRLAVTAVTVTYRRIIMTLITGIALPAAICWWLITTLPSWSQVL